MSPGWFKNDKDLCRKYAKDHNLKSVYAHLALLADDNVTGKCANISTRDLSEQLGLCRSTVIRAIEKLKKDGFIIAESTPKYLRVFIVTDGNNKQNKVDHFRSTFGTTFGTTSKDHFTEIKQDDIPKGLPDNEPLLVPDVSPLLVPLSGVLDREETKTKTKTKNKNIIRESKSAFLVAEEIANYWNATMPHGRVNISILSKNTQRQKAIESVVEKYGIDLIKKSIERISKSNFACGKNDHQWKADLAWLIKPENLQKIDEGKYDNKIAKVPREWNMTNDEILREAGLIE